MCSFKARWLVSPKMNTLRGQHTWNVPTDMVARGNLSVQANHSLDVGAEIILLVEL